MVKFSVVIIPPISFPPDLCIKDKNEEKVCEILSVTQYLFPQVKCLPRKYFLKVQHAIITSGQSGTASTLYNSEMPVWSTKQKNSLFFTQFTRMGHFHYFEHKTRMTYISLVSCKWVSWLKTKHRTWLFITSGVISGTILFCAKKKPSSL